MLGLLYGFACLTSAADVDLSKPPPKVAARAPVSMAGGKTDLVVQFTNWSSAVPRNDIVGEYRRGVFCVDPKPLLYNRNFDDWFTTNLNKNFRERTLALGFSGAERNRSVFDDKGAGGGADLRVGATLQAFDYRICGDMELKGETYAKVKWEVFSARQQRVVYTATLESGFAATESIPRREFEKAFTLSMVDALLADARFAELARTGSATAADPAAALPPLQVDVGQVIDGRVTKAAGGVLGAVVTVESGVGSGTAFYVSQEGYLLTNQHVVADARFVKVKLAGGRSLVGEVLRVDRQRDVALLRTDPVAQGVLALRPDAPHVGEEVYAVGSPFGAVLSGTLTRGVLSSRRVLEGVAYLQSDVAINPGSSGGPLVDAEGKVLGITQIGTTAQGINLFIPIEDALDKLGLVLRQGGAAAAAK